MKYSNLTLGQIEAIVNKLGGMESVERILSYKPGILDRQPPSLFTTDMQKVYGYDLTLLYHTPRHIVPGGRVEAVPFQCYTEGPDGSKLFLEAAELGAALGQEDAEWLLKEPQSIPDGGDLWFPGTQWWSRRAARVCIPVISKGKLCFNFPNGREFRFVRPMTSRKLRG